MPCTSAKATHLVIEIKFTYIDKI